MPDENKILAVHIDDQRTVARTHNGFEVAHWGKHDPRNHAATCTFHLDQYAFECDCGATDRFDAQAAAAD